MATLCERREFDKYNTKLLKCHDKFVHIQCKDILCCLFQRRYKAMFEGSISFLARLIFVVNSSEVGNVYSLLVSTAASSYSGIHL